MQEVIDRSELPRRIDEVVEDVMHRHVPYVVSRAGEPQAAVIPYADFVRWQQFAEQDVLERFQRLVEHMTAHNAAYSDDEVAADVAAALAEVRDQR